MDQEQTEQPEQVTPHQSVLGRRSLLRVAAVGGGVAISAPLLAACGTANSSGSSAGSGSSSGSGSSGGSGGTLTIGYVSPLTGPAAGFGEPDGYILSLARKAFASGLTIGGKKYDVKIVQKDGQSNPQRGSQVANDLINSEGIDMMLTTSTPETVNPVADACEAAGVPCISTVVPWEAFYFGRGAKPTDKKAFKYTYHFSFGTEDFANAYEAMWPQIPTNKKIAVLWPNDSDGNAIRAALGPLLAKKGYTIVDPGAYTDGTNDYSSQIAKFKAADCEIFNTFPLPPDFATFWQQAQQQGFKPKIAQVQKTGTFPSQVEALGAIGVDLVSTSYWSPTYPYKSTLTGITSADLSTGYEAASGKQWSQQLGASLALFDVAAAAFTGSGDPKNKDAVADAIGKVNVETPVGQLAWGTGPNGNVVATPVLGGQWVKATSGKYPLDFVICSNATDPKVPVGAKLQPFGA